jgi:hypothetical protein
MSVLAAATCVPRDLPQYFSRPTAATGEAANERITDFQGEIEPITQQNAERLGYLRALFVVSSENKRFAFARLSWS